MSSKIFLENKFQGIQLIRNWFLDRNFIDVMTPSLVQCPGIESHLNAFKVNGDNYQGYLQTSPEFHMKELLSFGLDKIFTLTYSFRDEPKSETHRPQFIMLEWYRAAENYQKIKEDIKSLIDSLAKNLPNVQEKFMTDFHEWTIKEAFQHFAEINLDKFNQRDLLYEKIKSDFKQLPLPEKNEVTWDDLFFLIFLNIIEPKLKNYPKVILTQYPASQAALSTLKPNDPTVCERFEVFLNGIEVGNCFNELTDLDTQRNRFLVAKQERQRLYHKEIPEPTVLFNALERGLPPCAGIAVGVERLIGILCQSKYF